MRKYNFISGLPRSGSTLLSSILKQNPRFTAGISDPLQMYAHSIITDTSLAAGMESTVNIDKRRQLIRGLFDNFYNDGSFNFVLSSTINLFPEIVSYVIQSQPSYCPNYYNPENKFCRFAKAVAHQFPSTLLTKLQQRGLMCALLNFLL